MVRESQQGSASGTENQQPAQEPHRAVEQQWPWVHWMGVHDDFGERSKTSLKDIFKDGYVGILVKPSGERIASIFDLKKSRREHGLIWREGVKMRKAISKRKILMYAIKRRVDASAAATPDGRLQEALSKLEEMRLNRDPESGRPQQKPRSLQQLINILSDDETGEIMPMQYEKAALLWDACKPMQGGNPKQRSKVSLMEEDQQ